MDAIPSTPHGAALADAGFSIARDIASDSEAAVHPQLASWIARRRTSPDPGTPAQIIEALTTALNGSKSGIPGLADYRAAQDQLAAIFGRALTV